MKKITRVLICFFAFFLTALFTQAQNKATLQKTKVGQSAKPKEVQPTVEETKTWILEKLNEYCRVMSYKHQDKEGGYITNLVRENNFRFENYNLIFDYYEESEGTISSNRTCASRSVSKGKIIINTKYFSNIGTSQQGYIENYDTYKPFPKIILYTNGQNISLTTVRQTVSYQCEKNEVNNTEYGDSFGIQVDYNAEPNLAERLKKAFIALKSSQKGKDAY